MASVLERLLACAEESGDGGKVLRLGAADLRELADERERAVTEQKRGDVELLEGQRMETLGRLAGGIAHDFNNMLSAIQGFARFIHEGLPETSPMREDAAEILRASTRAAALTRQLLAFSRRKSHEPKVIDVRQQVREMEKLLVRLLPEHSRLRIQMPAELDRVKIDPAELEQVILNLVVNAGEAMPDGGVITISAENTRVEAQGDEGAEIAPGRYVRLAVSDTGGGMPESVRRRIFEPFFTTKERERGTGLGLATVLGVVRRNGGRVRVESRPAHGTVFEVYFPFTPEAARLSLVPVSQQGRLGAGETILIVEDDDQVRELVRRMLERAGFAALVARDAEEALALSLVHGRELAVLVTDVGLPGMSGDALCEHLTSRHPGLVTVYMSGKAVPAAAVGALDVSALFVAKPIDPTTLLDAVREALRRHGPVPGELSATG